jgi:hypothetical protein
LMSQSNPTSANATTSGNLSNYHSMYNMI